MPVFLVAFSCDGRNTEEARLVKTCKNEFAKCLKETLDVTQIASSTWLVSGNAELNTFEGASSYLDPLVHENLYYRLVVLQIDKCEAHQVTGNIRDPKAQPLTDAVKRQILKIPSGGWFS